MVVRVGVDYDGVIADTQGFAIGYVNEHLDLGLGREDFVWRDGRPAMDIYGRGGMDRGFEEFVTDPDLIAALDPLPGVRRALRRLDEHAQFTPVVATHRPPVVHDAIEQWLATHGLPTLEVLDGVSEEKAETTPPLDVLVDDYHGYADAATRRGLLGVHLTAAWDSGEPTLDATISAASWSEAVSAIVRHGTVAN